MKGGGGLVWEKEDDPFGRRGRSVGRGGGLYGRGNKIPLQNIPVKICHETHYTYSGYILIKAICNAHTSMTPNGYRVKTE